MFNISSEHLQRHLVQLLCRVTFSPHRVSHRRSISQGKYYCLKIPHFQLQVLSIWNSHRCPGWAYDQLAQQLAQYGTTAACSIPFCGPGQGGSWRVHELPEPPTIFCGEGKQTNKWKKRCFSTKHSFWTGRASSMEWEAICKYPAPPSVCSWICSTGKDVKKFCWNLLCLWLQTDLAYFFSYCLDDWLMKD